MVVSSPIIIPEMSDDKVKEITQDFFNVYKDLRVHVLSMSSDERFFKELYSLSRKYYSHINNYIITNKLIQMDLSLLPFG